MVSDPPVVVSAGRRRHRCNGAADRQPGRATLVTGGSRARPARGERDELDHPPAELEQVDELVRSHQVRLARFGLQKDPPGHAMSGDVHDVPALGLLQHGEQPTTGHPVLQHPDIHGPPGYRDPLDHPDQRVPLAANVQRLPARGQAEQPEHPQPFSHQVGACAVKAPVPVRVPDQCDVMQGQRLLADVRQLKRQGQQ